MRCAWRASKNVYGWTMIDNLLERRMRKKVNSSERLRLHLDEWIGYHVLISAFAVPFIIGIVEIESFLGKCKG